jgi:LytS/YehU family sensor histidine kinase
MEFSNRTLYYLKNGVKEERPFKICGKVRKKLDVSGVNY